MTYIPDLSPYDHRPFARESLDSNLVAIGWLDREFPYSTGAIDAELMQKLRELAKKPVNLTRGYHRCQFCAATSAPELSEGTDNIGNGEIRVPGGNGITYAAPALICHYIDKHNYRPPDVFIQALSRFESRDQKIAIVAALEREVHPLVKNWRVTSAQHDGRAFTFYESEYAVVVCGGIGAEAGRRAAEAAIVHYSPAVVISAGIAGALVPELKVGETIFPAAVIDTQDGSRHETAIKSSPLANTPLGRTVIASSPQIAGVTLKQQLAKSYGAHAVDMEGAAVARAAQARGIPFLAIKTISDEYNFEVPEMERFIRGSELQTARFVFYAALRPWLWLRLLRLARNTQIASQNLCAWLRESALTNTIVGGAWTNASKQQ